jgi:hypothetical protein
MSITPATQEDILRKSKDKLWDIKAARLLDCENIKKWLEEEANNALSLDVIGHDKVKAKQYIEHALNKYATFSNMLENLYDSSLMRTDHKLLKDAEKGMLLDKAPTPSSIWLWFSCLVLAGGLEIVFFSYMVFSKNAGVALIGLAVLLLVGGFFAGQGVANIMTHSNKSEFQATEVKIQRKYIVLLGIGIALMVGVIVVRGVYGGPLAGIVAAFFGLAVTTTEAFWKYYGAMREFYLAQMFRAQQHYAAIQLDKDLGEKGVGKHLDDTWRVHYEQCINDIIVSLKDSSSEVTEAVEGEQRNEVLQ